jgi:hypothetical protein
MSPARISPLIFAVTEDFFPKAGKRPPPQAETVFRSREYIKYVLGKEQNFLVLI